MLSFVRFLRILQTSAFAVLLSVFSFDAFADNLTIMHWTGTATGGTVSGVARCGPKSGNSLGALKENWGTSNWGLQNAACYCRARDLDTISDWDSVPDNYTEASTLGATTYWYGSGTNFGSAALCLEGCASKCQELFDNDTSSYQSTLCGGTCTYDQTNPNPTPTTYTITYDLQGGTGCNTSDTYNIGQSATICTPTRDGYTFDGWMDVNTYDTYNGGDVVLNTNLTLEAFWTQCGTGYDVVGNACTCVSPKIVENGECITQGESCENNGGNWDGTNCQYCSLGWDSGCNMCKEDCSPGVWNSGTCSCDLTGVPINYISYCDSDLTTDLDIAEIYASENIYFPSVSSCPKNNMYETNSWTCVNSNNATQTTTISDGSLWNANFYDAYCYPNWVRKPTLNLTFYCDSNLADEMDAYETLVTDGITFPSASDLEYCAQSESYRFKKWTCVNEDNQYQTIDYGNVSHVDWDEDFTDIYCYANWTDPATYVAWECSDGEVEDNSDDYYPRGALDVVKEINSSTYYEFDGDEYQLLTGQSNSWNLSHALAAKNSGDTGSYAYQQYLAELDYYTSDQSWSVTFGNAAISGVAVCAARGWGTYLAENKNSGSSLQGVLTGTFVGCACSLDKERWIGAGQLSTSTNAWGSNNTFCRKNCPAACAYAVATDKEFRDTLFNGVCPIPVEVEPPIECDEGEFVYDNQCVNSCDDRFAYNGVCYTRCPSDTYNDNGFCVDTCGDKKVYENQCVDSCDDRFEYDGVCYETCPNGTSLLSGVCLTDCGDGLMSVQGECVPAAFTVETVPMSVNEEFVFTLSAAGTFYIDWGDGTYETKNKSSVGAETIRHVYTSSEGVHKIKLSGEATSYYSASATLSNQANVAAIRFGNLDNSTTNTASKVAGIYGSLGAIFHTIEGGGDTLDTQPRFYKTFNKCSNLESAIPTNLFSGIEGVPVEHMFFATFMECPKLSGTIPPHLFNGISGKPNKYTFDGTFSKCASLTGEIPSTLFENITGELDGTEDFLFAGTFYKCSGLTGNIPEYLFSGIQGAPTESMFNSTFYGCSSLSGTLPEHLFDTIRGPLVKNAFDETFMQEEENAGLTGFVPKNFFRYITNDDNITNGMEDIFRDSGIDTLCPIGYYKYDTIFDEFWSGRVSCEECPAGTTTHAPGALSVEQCCPYGSAWNGESCERTEFVCTSGKWLHLGDNTKLCLSETKPASHESPVVVRVQLGDESYYLYATPGAEYLPVNEDSINTKMKIMYKGRTYNIHDGTVSNF